MCDSSSITVTFGKEIKFCAFTGGLDVYLSILASLSGVVLLAWLLFVVTRSVTATGSLVSLSVFLQVCALWSTSSSWLPVKVQLLLGLWSLCTAAARFFSQSELLQSTTALLQAQVVSLHDTLRSSHERTAALCAELRETQATLTVKDNIIRDLQAAVDLDDNTIYDPDATLAAGNSDIDEVFAALSALRAEVAENTSLLTNARNAREPALEAKNESDARVDQLRTAVEEAKEIVRAQRQELENTVREIAELRAIITRCEANTIHREQDITPKDHTIAALENELANTQDELAEAQSALKAAQEVIGSLSTQFEEYDEDITRVQETLEAKLMLRDMEIEGLRAQLASARRTQREAQPEYTAGLLDTGDITLYSPSCPARLSSSLDRSSLTSSPVKPSPPSPTWLSESSSSAHCSTSPIRSCPPASDEPSFTIEDKLAEMDVSCDLLRDEFFFISKDQDSYWMKESSVKGKCALTPEEAGTSGRGSSCSEMSSFQIPAIGDSHNLLHNKDSFLAPNHDSHWLKDTPEKPKIVVKSQDVPAEVESSLCGDGNKSPFVMRLDNVSCDLLNDKMSLPEDEDSVLSQESLLKHLPPIKSKNRKVLTTSAPTNSWGEPRAAGDKLSFIMRVDDMSCDLLRDNVSFLPKDQGSSWLDDSKSSKMAAPPAFPHNSKGKERMLSCTMLQYDASFPSNLSNEFAKLVENASTPAKLRIRHAAEGNSPQPPSLSFMTLSSSMDAHAFALFKPHRSDSCFLTPSFAKCSAADPATPSPPQGSSKRARRTRNLLKASGTFQPLATHAPQY